MAESGRPGIEWRKSKHSGGGNCVEVAFEGQSVLVRNSKDPAGPALSFTHSEWIEFLARARKVTFDMHSS